MDQPDCSAPRHDYAVKVEGPLVAPVRAVMLRLWEIVVWAGFRRRYRLRDHARRPAPPTSAGDETAAFVVRDNIRHRRAIEDAYLEAIDAAQDEIVIANAYFLPGFRFRRALVAAAARGVRVCVLLQGRVEYRLQHYATQALYGVLLEAGIRIFEYQPSFLHAKVAVTDGVWSTVGSSNIDPFSLLLAREANVIVRDRGFAKSRLLRWACYQIVRAAVGLAGYRGGH
jgi:cardiolipin synthase